MTSHCFRIGGQRLVIDSGGIAEHEAGPQRHERRVDVAAEVDVLQEVDPERLAQDGLQPLPPQLVPRAAHQIDQVPAETQDVRRIERRLVVAWRGPGQVDLEQRVEQHGPGGAVPFRSRLQVVDQQSAVAEGLLGTAANDIGGFDDLVPDDEQDVAGAVVVEALGLPMDGGERWPRAAMSPAV